MLAQQGAFVAPAQSQRLALPLAKKFDFQQLNTKVAQGQILKDGTQLHHPGIPIEEGPPTLAQVGERHAEELQSGEVDDEYEENVYGLLESAQEEIVE